MRLKLGTLALALAAGGVLPALAQTCTPTAITPYINVNGTWTQTSSATLKLGTSAIFGPQPVSGGSWSWSGCGTAGASREQTISPSAACTATATYTNSCGAKSTQTFNIGVGTWANVKYGGGGYVTGLIFHPKTKDVLYARTDVGGAYRWDAGTSSWIPLSDGLGVTEGNSRGVESIAVDPTNDQRVYMVGDMAISANPTAKLYISNNRGNSWTSVNLPFSAGGNNNGRAIGERLAVDPTNPSILFYASRTAGLWKSADSGQTWTQTGLSSTKLTQTQINNLGGQVMGVEQLIFDNSAVGGGATTWVMYATIAPDYVTAAGLSSNLYKSVNGGASWTPVTTPVSGYHIPHVVRTSDGMYYVLFTKGAGPGDSGPARFYKFDGSNWTQLKSSDSGGFSGLSVSGTGSTARIALGVSGAWNAGQPLVQLSDDGGRNWREIEDGTSGVTARGWVDDVEIDPFNRDRILHVHGGGIIETRNASASAPTWSNAVNGLEETCTLSLKTPPAGASYTFINSSGDVGTWLHTNLSTTPTLSPYKNWSNGNSADMAWSDPTYIVANGRINNPDGSAAGTGYWSGNSGQTWASFSSLPAGASTNTSEASNVAVTTRNNVVWAPADSVPSYTTNNGASWTATNLPALAVQNGVPRSYRLVADRRNPNKVYAYDSGGAWWTYTQAKVYVSTDGGHNFTLSQGSVSANMRFAPWGSSSMAVNPYVEGDLWVADGLALYHSTDSGASWTKLNAFAPNWGTGRNDWDGPLVAGASIVTLGKPKPGSNATAAVYVVGINNGVWGVWRSDDGGSTWVRHNDDAHQWGGVGVMTADQATYGRVYVGGSCRGVNYSN